MKDVMGSQWHPRDMRALREDGEMTNMLSANAMACAVLQTEAKTSFGIVNSPHLNIRLSTFERLPSRQHTMSTDTMSTMASLPNIESGQKAPVEISFGNDHYLLLWPQVSG